MTDGDADTFVIVIDDEVWLNDQVDKVDLSDDPAECAGPYERDTKRTRIVLFKLKGGVGGKVKICFEDEDKVPFKNWDRCKEGSKGTLVGHVDAPSGKYKYSVYIDDEAVCDPIIWVQ